jgi:4-aminobutyrate aminotransferase-like enzyme
MPTLAAKLAEEAPGDLDCCYITNSGSEANEMAVMTARADTQEPMVVSLQHGYHGGTSTPLSLCGHSNWKFRSQPQAAVTHARAPYCYRCPFGRERGSCDLECVDDVRMTIETTTSGTIAAMIVEPVLGVGGFIEPPLDYHKEVYKIVKEHGGLYISDEVQTGAGRTGKHFFAIEESGVVPDIISFAKGIGNGAPVGGVITRKDIAQSLKGKLHFNTFGGDPYQSMQAAEVIDIINQEGLISNADVMGNTLRQGFAELKKDYPIIGDIRGRGLLLGLELVKDPVTKEIAPAETARFMELCKEEGVLIGKGSLFGNVIRIAPSLAITEDECEQLLRSCQRAFAQL